MSKFDMYYTNTKHITDMSLTTSKALPDKYVQKRSGKAIFSTRPELGTSLKATGGKNACT
ncbi:protein of unknown function [Rhodovastum atsumiense]|nr:protein of unknown function [Rhodovastum atsumiense]